MKQQENRQRFCRNCATVLTDTDISCPQCGFAVGTGMRYCPYCGDPVAVGAVNCTTCNQSLAIAGAKPVGGSVQTMAMPQEMPDLSTAQQVRAQPIQQPVQPQSPPQQGGYVYTNTRTQGGYAYQNGTVPQNGVVYTSAQQKSKVAAGILGIMLGSLGVHNFYLGYVGKGVAQLLLTLLSCGMFTPIVSIWALVEGIMILCGSINTDGKGIPLKD